ncbi:MAG: DUF1080 domain-containing protein [Saprospiraceae bacterium]|nr:DUF1080 domain-containing protein [Saprospiraceae bacterium]
MRTIQLHEAVRSEGIRVFNRTATLIDEPSYQGIRLSKEYGEGVAWLTGVEFSNGTIEFDVRGEDVKQHSFVGLAFHGQNDSTYDAIYLRPFQFRAPDEVLRHRSIQYVSFPDFTWRRLRALSPGKYENAVDPAPDPNAWMRVRIVVQGTTVSTYINGNPSPSLVVEKVTAVHTGSIGFYVADTSGGDFANISITKTPD